VAGSAFSMGNALGPLLGGVLTGIISPRAVIAAASLTLLGGRLLVTLLERAVIDEQHTGDDIPVEETPSAAPRV
jgi:hypothetical protein